MYYYEASLVRVIDGDTFEADVDLGFNVSQRVVFRLAGCDTPEVRGPESTKGHLVSAYVSQWFHNIGNNFCVDVLNYDRWGRSVAHVAPRAPTYMYPLTLTFDLIQKRLAWVTNEDGRLTEMRDPDSLLANKDIEQLLLKAAL